MGNLELTLNQLEGRWPDPPEYPSHLVEMCHKLRRKPLKDFTVEDLRIMIGQNIGLKYLVPLAVDRLEAEPLVEGDYYPGDLLKSVLSVEAAFWKTHAELHRRVAHSAGRAMRWAKEQDEDQDLGKWLSESILRFMGRA